MNRKERQRRRKLAKRERLLGRVFQRIVPALPEPDSITETTPMPRTLVSGDKIKIALWATANKADLQDTPLARIVDRVKSEVVPDAKVNDYIIERILKEANVPFKLKPKSGGQALINKANATNLKELAVYVHDLYTSLGVPVPEGLKNLSGIK